MNKKFLKPVPMLVASLLASGVAGSIATQADASGIHAGATQELLLKSANDEGTTPLGHRSHASHASHASHTSHQSGFMGQ